MNLIKLVKAIVYPILIISLINVSVVVKPFNPSLATAKVAEKTTVQVIEAITIFWEISFKLASPIIAIIFIVDCGLGILARTVPQMNMFVIGLPLKMIILFIMMVITMQLLPAFNNMIIQNMTNTFFNILQGLMP